MHGLFSIRTVENRSFLCFAAFAAAVHVDGLKRYISVIFELFAETAIICMVASLKEVIGMRNADLEGAGVAFSFPTPAACEL